MCSSKQFLDSIKEIVHSRHGQISIKWGNWVRPGWVCMGALNSVVIAWCKDKFLPYRLYSILCKQQNFLLLLCLLQPSLHDFKIYYENWEAMADFGTHMVGHGGIGNHSLPCNFTSKNCFYWMNTVVFH